MQAAPRAIRLCGGKDPALQQTYTPNGVHGGHWYSGTKTPLRFTRSEKGYWQLTDEKDKCILGSLQAGGVVVLKLQVVGSDVDPSISEAAYAAHAKLAYQNV